MNGFWSRLSTKRDDESGAAMDDSGPPPPQPTKALRKFLAAIESRENPVIVDLGPVVGANVAFFGESLGCKVFIEDVYADLERHARAGTLEELPAVLARRFAQPDGSVDGVLCWDVLDYLQPAAAQALAAELCRLLRPDGVLLGFFSTALAPGRPARKYVIVDEGLLQHRVSAVALTPARVLQNRDIIKLFGSLRVSDSFLLQTHMREILFRKPAYLAQARPGA